MLANFHHIACDGFSATLFIRQVFESYKSLISSNTLPDLNPDNYSYIQYLHSEKEYVESDKFTKDKTYWSKIYEDIPDIATIYSRKIESDIRSFESQRETFHLDNSIMEKIMKFCADYKVSAYNFFMSVFGIYISKVSKIDDFVIRNTNFK